MEQLEGFFAFFFFSFPTACDRVYAVRYPSPVLIAAPAMRDWW